MCASRRQKVMEGDIVIGDAVAELTRLQVRRRTTREDRRDSVWKRWVTFRRRWISRHERWNDVRRQRGAVVSAVRGGVVHGSCKVQGISTLGGHVGGGVRGPGSRGMGCRLRWRLRWKEASCGVSIMGTRCGGTHATRSVP